MFVNATNFDPGHDRHFFTALSGQIMGRVMGRMPPGAMRAYQQAFHNRAAVDIEGDLGEFEAQLELRELKASLDRRTK